MPKRTFTPEEIDRLWIIRDGLNTLMGWCDCEVLCEECPFHQTNLCEQLTLSDNIAKLIDAVEGAIND